MRHWSEFAIIASGPSLTVDQCDYIRSWREADDERRVIVINRSFRRALWADFLYACDGSYLRYEIDEIRRDFKGEVWTQDQNCASRFTLKYVKLQHGPGLSRDRSVIHHGGHYRRSGQRGSGNGGFQAINLAVNWGAKRIVLVGYDMKTAPDGKKHWHEPHKINVNSPYSWWIKCYEDLAEDLQKENIVCLNATPDSELYAFPQVRLSEALYACPVPAA